MTSKQLELRQRLHHIQAYTPLCDMNLPEEICALLVNLAYSIGVPGWDGIQARYKLSELAKMSREEVLEAFEQAKAEGLVPA